MKSDRLFLRRLATASISRPTRVLAPTARLTSGHVGLLTLFLGFAMLTLSAQRGTGAVIEAWVQRYNSVVSNSFDRTTEIVVDNAGDIIVGGGTGATGVDMLIIKYSGVDGSMIWQRRDEGPGRSLGVFALAVTTNGDVVATGYAQNAGRREQYIAKYATLDGALLWERRYVAWTNTASAVNTEVVVDNSGNIVAIGAFYTQSEGYDSHVTKYADDGTLLWQKSGITKSIFAAAVDNNDNVVITGGAGSGTKSYTAKYAAADGSLVWENLEEGGVHISVDQNGDVMVAGTHATRNDGMSHDFYTAKLAGDDGDLIWQKSYNGPGNHNDLLMAAALDGAGNVVVTGISYENTGLSSSYMAKYASADGAILWEQRDGASGALAISGSNVVVIGSSRIFNYAADNGALIWERTAGERLLLAVDLRGDVAVTGSTGGQGYEGMNSYTARFALADGALIWEQSYNGTANGTDHARAVALDPLGNAIVTGRSPGSGGGSDYYTAKYAKSNGALLWENRAVRGEACCVAVDRDGNAVVFGFNGTVRHAAGDGRILWYKSRPLGDAFVPIAVGVDSSNNVVVTGWTVRDTEQGSKFDYYTAKYAAADGALLWERHYDSPEGLPDHPAALAIDSSDNVIVTGASGGSYTVKYRAADGAVLWEKRNSERFSSAVAVDRAGNVAIAGGGGGVSSDYYTAMFAAENGALLWEQRYDIRGYSDDVVKAMAVDQDGNVIVTGVTVSSGRDSYTIKYHGANGTRLWEKRYAGTGASQAIGVDDRGNVVVSGTSWNGTKTDYNTVKYAARDGTLLWQQRYDGPENGHDSIDGSRSLAVGKDGLIVVTGSSDAFNSRGSTIEASDYATVAYRDGLPPVSLEMDSSGVRLRLSGVPERTYDVQRSLTVAGPWATIATVTAASDGTIDYTDAGQPAGSAFYRVVHP